MASLKSQVANRKSQITVGAVLLLAALLRFIPLGLTNPRFYHVDEWDYVQSATRMWAEGTLDPGPPYDNPGLYRYAIAAVYPVVPHLLGGMVGPEVRAWLPYVTGRLVSAAAGVLAVWLVYRLSRRLMPGWGALAAAVILAVAPLHVRFSHIAKSDVTTATFVALATLLAWRLAEAPRRGLYVWAGVAVGLAVASKYSGIVAAAPVVVAHLAAPGKRPLIKRAFAPDLWLAGLCSIVAFVATSPYTLITTARGIDSLGHGYGLLIARPPNPQMLPQASPLVAFGRLALGWLGPLPLALAAVGALLWWRERRKALLVVGSVVVATVAMLSLWAVQLPHYLLPLVPALATLAAVPVARAGSRRFWAPGLLALCLAPSAVSSAREIICFWRPETRQLAKAWLIEHVGSARGNILRDYDSLEATADDVLPVIDPGYGFYDLGVVNRAYLKRQNITHFVLSDAAAATGHLTPEAARQRADAHARLIACGDLLTRFSPGWWRDGPGIEIYRIKESVLAEFEREREEAARELRAKVKEAEDRLAAAPNDVALHMEAGRLLCDQAAASPGDEAVGLWQRAEGHFRAAGAAAPKSADARYNAGCLHLRIAAWKAGARRHEEAAAYFARAADAFRAAIALDPNQADYHFNLGYALCSLASAATRNEGVRRHALEEGVRAYRRAEALDPNIRVPDPENPEAPHILAVAERGPQPFH